MQRLLCFVARVSNKSVRDTLIVARNSSMRSDWSCLFIVAFSGTIDYWVNLLVRLSESLFTVNDR